MPKNIIRGNTINVNNKYNTLDKIRCKDYYWHIINIKNTLLLQLVNGQLIIKTLTVLKAIYGKESLGYLLNTKGYLHKKAHVVKVQ